MTPETAPATMTHVETLEACGYEPRVGWVCNVVSSGYHSGSGCDPTEPHGGQWSCGYRVVLSIPITREQYEKETHR